MQLFAINYNPYLPKMTVTLNGKDITSTGDWKNASKQTLQFNINAFGDWKGLKEQIKSECNYSDIRIIFTGRECDYEDLCALFEDDDCVLATEFHPEYEWDSQIQELKEWASSFKLGDKLIKDFNKRLEKPFNIYVVGNTSSGKSSLINALMRKNILVANSKDDTTKNIVHILSSENDSLSLKNGNPVTDKYLERCNAKGTDLSITGQIPFAEGFGIPCSLNDTPGSNTGDDEIWQARQRKVLDSLEDDSLVIFVTPYAEYDRESQIKWIRSIKEYLVCKGERGKQISEQFVFVMTCMATEDVKTDKIGDTINSFKKFLIGNGIISPVIIPVDSKYHLSTFMDEQGVADLYGGISLYQEIAKQKLEQAHLHEHAVNTPIQTKRDSLIMNDISGIAVLEETIRQYCIKYVTAKRARDAGYFLHSSISKACNKMAEKERIKKEGEIKDIQDEINTARDNLSKLKEKSLNLVNQSFMDINPENAVKDHSDSLDIIINKLIADLNESGAKKIGRRSKEVIVSQGTNEMRMAVENCFDSIIKENNKTVKETANKIILSVEAYDKDFKIDNFDIENLIDSSLTLEETLPEIVVDLPHKWGDDLKDAIASWRVTKILPEKVVEFLENSIGTVSLPEFVFMYRKALSDYASQVSKLFLRLYSANASKQKYELEALVNKAIREREVAIDDYIRMREGRLDSLESFEEPEYFKKLNRYPLFGARSHD